MKPIFHVEPGALRSEKILPRHWERLAIVYVRQSTPQQVLLHQESTRLQYGLKARAMALGWAEDRVLVIDDDLGCSGSSAEGRLGFQRLVSEVGLDHVGIILGVEMSRLARSCKDWHQLLEICALFGTLIADLDGTYDPAHYNDRLLLGLKGTMSEAELHILKQRMNQGRLQKAGRGELPSRLPAGYVRRPSGEVQFDPDEQVQHVVRLVFRKFEELGTVHAVLRYLVNNNIQIGARSYVGPNKGDLEWRRPNRMTLQHMLKNPTYAGAYAYGRRELDPRKKKAGRPGSGRAVRTAQACAVLLKDRHPAYISWEQYERNQAKLAANQSRWDRPGAIRRGPSLLAGLLACAKCGCRLTVSYGGQQNRHAYVCSRRTTSYGAELCLSIAGPPLDQFLSHQVLRALEPAALELSLEAAEHLERDREELTRLWRQRLDRASYETDRAGRQYRLVEPENRLVARQLERDWEDKLAAQRKLEEEFRRFEQAQPRVLTQSEREVIRRIASDIPALWAAPTTTAADRKALMRQVIDRVLVATQEDSEQVRVVIQWAGGMRTESVMIRPVAKLDQLSYYTRLCERVRELAGAGLAGAAIADQLNREGFRPPKRREKFGRKGVNALIRRLGLRTKPAPEVPAPKLGPNEWTLPDLARELGMPTATLYSWNKRGWLKARYEDGLSRRRLVIWADTAELASLRERHQRPAGYYSRR